MKRLKSILVLLLIFVIAFPLNIFAADATYTTDKVGGKSANIATYTYTKNSKVLVTLGEDSVNKDEYFADHVTKATNELGAAPALSVNGGYFNSYYKSANGLSYPDNCARTYAMLFVDGQVVNGGGVTKAATLGFTNDGEVLIDKVKAMPYCTINGTRYDFWGANSYFADDTALMLFTEELGYAVEAPDTATALFVKDGAIERIQSGGTITVESGYSCILFQSGCWEVASKWNDIRVGSKVSVEMEFTADHGAAGWNNIQTAISAGPWLVCNGQNVADQNPEMTEAKVQPDYAAGRTFIGVKADNTIVVGVATCTPRQAADYLISLGCTDGMCLDGGGSSALAVNGSVVCPNTYRKLSNVIHIYEKPAPSSWAEAEVNEGISSGLVPAELQSKYQTAITRVEFCNLTVQYLKQLPNYQELLKSGKDISFTDTTDENVLICAKLGIINGVGNDQFNPNGLITREQAAKILAKTAQLAGKTDSGTALTFNDADQFSSWAGEFIDYCTRNKIMNGVGEGFNPKGNYTREQAIITIVRMK